MRRVVSIGFSAIFLILTLSLCLVSTPTYAAEGYWQLKDVTIDLAKYDNDAFIVTADKGYASYQRTDKNSKDVFAASADWSAPNNSYLPGEEVKLTLNCSVETYAWNGTEGSFHGGLNFMGYHISARFDDVGVPYGFAGNSSISLKDKDGKNVAKVVAENGKILKASDQITVSTKMQNGYRDGDETCLYVAVSSTCNVCYIYTFIADGEITAQTTTGTQAETVTGGTQIWLFGQVLNVSSEPMPRMKITVGLYLDASAYKPGQAAKKQYETVTDIDGQFYLEIPLPKNQEKELALLVKTYMTCKLPDEKTPYYFVDVKEAASDGEIWASSLIKVAPSDTGFGQMGVIPVRRQFSFFNLFLDSLSFNNDGTPDQYSSNITDSYTVAASSFQYRLVWDAMFFGSVILDEVATLKTSDLRIETRWERATDGTGVTVSHYQSDGVGRGGGTIRLTPDTCRLNDESKFTILHEYGHYFDSITNNGDTRATSLQPANIANSNHGGYFNENTADSYMEGFASAFAAMVQNYRKDANPHRIGIWDLGTAGRYVAYENVNTNEEFAIATLLYQTSRLYTDKLDFWKVLDPNRKNFKEYYNALAEDLKSDQTKLSKLETLAEKGGLYKMPFGNNQYDLGEPFIDKNSNGLRDNRETFGDLMFAIGPNGSIDFYTPLRPLIEKLEYGVSSDNLRTRNTISKQSNSYLYLVGASVSDLLIRVYNDDGSESCFVVSVEGNKIYLPVANLDSSSWIDVYAPGGGIIYSSEVGPLKNIFNLTMGVDVPLDTATVFSEDLSQTGQWAMPAEGRVDFAEVLAIPEPGNAAAANNSVTDNPDNIDIGLSLEQLANEQNGRPWKSGSLRWEIILLLVSTGLLLLLAIILVLVIRKPKVNTVKGYALPNVPIPTTPTYAFCTHCGVIRKPDAKFCHNCGNLLK